MKDNELLSDLETREHPSSTNALTAPLGADIFVGKLETHPTLYPIRRIK